MNVAHRLVELRDTINIDPMLRTEAVNLLAKKLNTQTDDIDLQELAAVLEFMPLAIVQAAAYIQKRAPRCSIRRYINEFADCDQARISLLNHEAGHLRRDTEARNSIILTLQISFNYIRDRWPSSAGLLSLMSFFDREGIPEYVLSAPCQEKGELRGVQQHKDHESTPNWNFESDLVRLQDYSFISTEASGHTFSMLRLVQYD